MITLRLQATMEDIPIHDLPEVFSGNRDECNDYAKKNGWTWRAHEDYLYNGYWIKDGQCLLPT